MAECFRLHGKEHLIGIASVGLGERRQVAEFTPVDGTIGLVEGHQVIDGLAEGEEIVLSGQFLFDSESRLKEAIAKMLEVRSKGSGGGDDLDMDSMTMEDDDLDMNDMTMDSEEETQP